MLNSQAKRATSANLDRLSFRSSDNRRCSSAIPARQQEAPSEIESEDVHEDSEAHEEHSVGCPWRKARSHSKNRVLIKNGSNSGLVHPRPWGARNPSDIPCFCKSSSKVPSRQSRSPIRLNDLRSKHEKELSKAKVAGVVSALCTHMDRKKIRVSDYELDIFLETVKDKMQKYKDIPQNTEKPKREPPAKEKSPLRRPRTAQSLVAAPQGNVQTAGLRENPADQKRTAAQPVLGKLETKKYVLELRSDDQVPSGLKQMLGMMHPQEPQFVLMDGPVGPGFVPASDELRQYAVLNAGVQLRHHEENTMLLVGNQRVTTPPRLKQPPLPALPPQRQRRA